MDLLEGVSTLDPTVDGPICPRDILMRSPKRGTCSRARTQPILLGGIQDQVVGRSRRDVDRGVPADVAASEGGDAGFAVAGENPLLTVFVLEVTDVDVRFFAVDDRWVATGCGVMVRDF